MSVNDFTVSGLTNGIDAVLRHSEMKLRSRTAEKMKFSIKDTHGKSTLKLNSSAYEKYEY